jgi:hypothetical protein
MQSSDPGIITAEEIAQGWNAAEDKYQLHDDDLVLYLIKY